MSFMFAVAVAVAVAFPPPTPTPAPAPAPVSRSVSLRDILALRRRRAAARLGVIRAGRFLWLEFPAGLGLE